MLKRIVFAALLLTATSACGGGTDAADTATAGDTATDDTAADTTQADSAADAITPADVVAADAADVASPDVPPDVPADVPPPPDGAGDIAADVPVVAAKILPGPSRGSSIAVSPDEAIVVACNRDAGSVTVLKATYTVGAPTTLTKVVDLNLGATSEPWQVVISPDSDTAYVVLRADQKVTKITGLKTDPYIGTSVAVGSEPVGIAMSPTGKWLAVTNWVDGTVSMIDTTAGSVAKTVDLNSALVATKALGDVVARPGLAHPRGITISNNGDAEDNDETILITEWYAQRTTPDLEDGSNADTSKQGLVYRLNVKEQTVTTIGLPALPDMGFKDQNGNVAGCFPNQLHSVAVNGDLAFVTSVCASPKGPIGPFTGPANAACVLDADCPGKLAGSCTALKCTTNCAADADCGATGGKCTGNKCEANGASVKTAIGNVISVIDLKTSKVVNSVNLNAKFRDLFDSKTIADDNSRRFPLIISDIAFVPDTGIGYVTANGADAVFRVKFNGDGTLAEVGSSVQLFIDLANAAYDPKVVGRGPTGLGIPSLKKNGAFVNNDITHNVTVVEFATQDISGGPTKPSVTNTAALPDAGSDAAKILAGKRFFNTGIGRWSLKGQAWNGCASCHVDGLTDNVTWHFARGPRQSTSLDGSFNSKDGKDRRLFNWGAILDEVADFENNTRGVSGGVGAIVSKNTPPIGAADRIDIAAAGHGGLNGSATAAADPKSGAVTPPSVLDDWDFIYRYMQTIRSPRGVSGLNQAKVDEGKAIYVGANCQGCHGGPKWTISKVFYSPSVDVNTKLKAKVWTPPLNFPAALLPAATAINRFMRFGGANAAAFDQIQCMLRPVGTFKVSEKDVGVAELRADMKAVAQGAEIDGNGYNPPSLLGLATGAPYFHAGNARTLEGALSTIFDKHHTALAANFLQETDPAKRALVVNQIVHFLLSIDEGSAAIAAPAAAAGDGGDFCAAP